MHEEMNAKEKCRVNGTIFREAKKCITILYLEYLKVHWEPSEHPQRFIGNVLYSKKRPKKKFRLLYELVEDKADENGSF